MADSRVNLSNAVGYTASLKDIYLSGRSVYIFFWYSTEQDGVKKQCE